MTKILIVEDDGLIAFDLAQIVQEHAAAETTVVSSVADAWCEVTEGIGFDYVLLDIDMIDGKTFDLAQFLSLKNVPFAFASGCRRDTLPRDLQSAPFLMKPYSRADVTRLLGPRFKDAAFHSAN